MTEILLLMPQDHRRSVFTADSMNRLRRCGKLSIADTATDHDRPDVRDQIACAEIIVTGTGTAKLDAAVLDGAPNLRAVVHAAGSVRPVVDADVYERGIQISSQALLNALPVAEYTLAMILLELKGALALERIYRRARTEVDVDGALVHHGVYGRRVGIISASGIGRRVIELLRPFDLEVVVSDPFLSAEDATALGVEAIELPTLLATSDVVSLHAPLLPETVGMIGAAELAALRDGAVFINTARGALVDQEALISELASDRIRAVIDVTDPETPASDSALWELESLVLTPHVAGSRGLELRRIGEGVVDEVERLVNGEALVRSVTLERYARNA